MDVFKSLEMDRFEQVVFCSDSKTGLRAIIALHSTVLGPATGGCRLWNYQSEQEALVDVLRLSKGMTYKASVSGLDWGGGKAVILGDPKHGKNPAMLERFGDYVDRLGGNYITAKDVGIGSEDLKNIRKKTQHVLGIEGEKGSSGDPSVATALGVYKGMRACARFTSGANSLSGMKIALQGLGTVSHYLLEHLVKDGAAIVGCDIDHAKCQQTEEEYGIKIVPPDSIYDVDCDIFAPMALGATVNLQTLDRIRGQIISGAANNQLASPLEGERLLAKGIVYAPDYVINAGGLINIYYEAISQGRYDQNRAFEHVARIEGTLTKILERAKSERIPTNLVADRIAEERILKALER